MPPEKRTVHPDDLFRLQFIHDGRLSPDGTRVVYALSHVDGEGDDEKEHMALWLASLDGGQARQLTSGKTSDSTPRWSPDGKQIAFMSARGEKPQLYLIPVDGGEARPLTKLKQGVGGGPEWSPDGKHIAFTAMPEREPRDPAKPYRLNRHPYRFDGMGYLDDVVQDIYVVNVDSGEVQQLTTDRAMNSQPQWSPDGQEILYSVAFDVESKRWEPGLRVVNLKGEVRDVVKTWGQAGVGAWLPDGKRVAFIGLPFGKPVGTKSDLWVVDAQGGTPKCRTEGLKVGVGGGLQGDMPAVSFFSSGLNITADGKHAYTQVQAGGTVGIFRIALEGKEHWEAVITGERTCKLLDVDRAQRHLLYLVSSYHDPVNLYVADSEGSGEKRLTQVNADFLGQLLQPEVETLKFTSVDGAEIEGWLMKPPQGKAPYPAILYIHGGPWGAFGSIYSFDFNMLAGAGYAVLFVNYRGSTGYGSDFSTAIAGDWGNLDYQDQMAGLDDVIAKGLADPDRLGVCGLSAGGYGTCWTVGQTDRFKAAVAENPVTNLATLYTISDISLTLIPEFLGGKPHEIPEVYAHCSPITYAHCCKTPTLLIQGEHDWRCPTEQSEQFYSVLKDNGCIVEMLRLPGSPHVGSMAGPLPVRRAQNDALLDWMNRYVLGKNGTS
jgi:dipeptidyl aminopeptidase/acylaminoacyl peptidase